MLKLLLQQHPKILAECAIAERLRRTPNVELDPLLYNAPLIYGPKHARDAMTAIYTEYITAADEAELPLLMSSPTWRVDPERLKEAGGNLSLNTDAVNYMLDLREKFPGNSPVLVGALTGPRNDCYRPELAPNAEEAEEFHSAQITELGKTNADYLHAQTLPSVTEALGISRAMTATGKPYIISFCVGVDGNVLDGTSLPEAFRIIDSEAPPTAYYVNCTHPQFLLNSYRSGDLDRLSGIQANGSSLDVTQLDGSCKTIADPVQDWAKAMLELHHTHGIKILGGCCGTSLEHMQSLI